jgi:hypothetical protein
MPKTTPEQNKVIVLKAFDTLFNRRDYNAAERFWSPTYIQHSAHIAPGRGGLFNLVRSAPNTLRYACRGAVHCGRHIHPRAGRPQNLKARPRTYLINVIKEDVLCAEPTNTGGQSSAFPCRCPGEPPPASHHH